MKERPILFTGPMVRAILAGTKTQTRRVLAPRGLGFIDCCCGGRAARWVSEGDRWHCGVCGGGARLTARDVEYLRCPYGQPGDRLWVRETHLIEPHPADFGLKRSDIPHTWDAAVSVAGKVLYRADQCAELLADGRAWTPSIHMPRWASRILLEITAVRVERLQEISEADAKAEGILYDPGEGGTFHVAGLSGCASDRAADSYRKLWESINGPESWGANPWVWVLDLSRIGGDGGAA